MKFAIGFLCITSLLWSCKKKIEEEPLKDDTGSSLDSKAEDEDESVNIPSNITGSYLTCSVRSEWQASSKTQEVGCRLSDKNNNKADLSSYDESWAFSESEKITQKVVDHPTWHVLYNIRGESAAEVEQIVDATTINLTIPLPNQTLKFSERMGSILESIDLFNDPDVDVGPVGIDPERPGSL